METSNELQLVVDKIKKKGNLWMWGAGLAGILIISPLVWALTYAVLGAAALGASLAVLAAVGGAIIYMAPVVKMKLENKKIEYIVNEATKSPIPTLRAEWNKDGEEIEAFEQQIIEFDGAVESSFKQVQSLAKDMKPEDFAQFQTDYEAQKADVAAQYADLAELKANHTQSDIEIKRLNAVWESANAMSKANAMNMATRRLDAISAIKRDSALKAVLEASARSKAQMRARMEQRKLTTPALTDARIDGEVITAFGQPVKVKMGS